VSSGLARGKAKICQIFEEEALWGKKEPPHSRFVVLFGARGRSFPEPLCQKGCFLAAVVLKPLWAASGIFEDQGKAIAERDFFGLPGGGLAILPGIIPYRLPFLVEPVQITRSDPVRRRQCSRRI